MSELSPGPWVWTNLDDENDHDQPVALRDCNGKYVIEPYLGWSLEPGEGLDEWGMEISDDDARLIAAAPDLLHELKAARLELEAYCLAESGEDYNKPSMNAAIAKAEGHD